MEDNEYLKDFYDFDVENTPDTHTRSYVAKIVGTHPRYFYDRRFLPLKSSTFPNHRHYSCDMDEYGVYERSTKRYNEENKCVDRTREFFVMFDGEYYDIEASEVLFTLFNLKLQTGAAVR